MKLRDHPRLRFRPDIALGLLLVIAVNGSGSSEKEAATPSPILLPGSAFRVEWGSADVPNTMTVGRATPVVVNVKNASYTTWPDRAMGHPSGNGIGAVRLAYRWWRAGPLPTVVADYAPGDRAELPAPLPPGATTTLTIAVNPPAQPGSYLLQLELVQEMVSWFEARGAATLKVPVQVKEGEVAAEAAVASPSPPVRPAIVITPASPDLSGLRVMAAAMGFVIVVPLAFGYLIARGGELAGGAERMAWVYAIGFAALVFALGAAATFFPARGHGPVLAVGSVVLLVLMSGPRARLAADVREGWRSVVVVTGIAAASMIILNWPSVSSGDTVFFDGHGNNDGFYNVGTASWLLDHHARAIPEWSVSSPLFFPVLDLIGLHSAVTRLGAESLLAAAAATTGHDPIEIYLPLLSALLLPWLATAFLIVRRGWARRRFSVAPFVLLAALQPLFLFFFANGNFPNLVGLLPCTLLLLLFRWQQTEARPPFGIAALALATAATLATYPEVLVVTCVGLGVLVLASLRRLPMARTARAVLAMAVGVALNPLVARRAVGGVRTAITAGSGIAGGQPWFSTLRPEQVLPAAVTLSFDAAAGLPIAAALVLSVSIVVAIVVAWRRMDERALGVAAVAALAAVWALGWYRQMPYAYQKGVQWSALMVCTLLAVGIVECLRSAWTARRGGGGRAWARLGLAAAAAICTAWLVVATVQGTRRMLSVASVKRIDSAFRGVATLAKRVPPGAPIAIRDLPLGTDGFFAMWIPYFLRDHPVFFEWGEPPSNYLSVLVRNSARVPLTRPPYVLAPAGTPPGPGETPLARNSRFWLLAVDGDVPQPALGPVQKVPLSVDGVATVETVDAKGVPIGGEAAVSTGSKATVIEGSAYHLRSHTCPSEVYLGLADAQGTVVTITPAERFVRYSYVWTLGFPRDAACGFRARVDPARLKPGTYYFRAFQLTREQGFYTNPTGDPRLIVRP